MNASWKKLFKNVYFCLSVWVCARVGDARITTVFPLPVFPDEVTTRHPVQAMQLWQAGRPCRLRDGAGRCVAWGGAAWSPAQEQEFAVTIKDMSEGIRTLLQK